MRKGLFISVDGPNGAGKTTFIRTLVENLSVNYDIMILENHHLLHLGLLLKRMKGG